MPELSLDEVNYPCEVFGDLIRGNSPYAFYLLQWVPYQTDARRWRLKMLHDVRTFDGREAFGIWPNGEHCGPFRDDEVAFIRISRKQFGHEWSDPRPVESSAAGAQDWMLERAKTYPQERVNAVAAACVEAQAVMPDGHHKLDTDTHVFFYEQDFYVLSNFSAFTLQWKGLRFDTSEAAYQWEKFTDTPRDDIRDCILHAPSAHVAFKIAEVHKPYRRLDWDRVKVDVMREILRAKAEQHEYVRRKLLATGDRKLVEDSWRDDFWGWGPNRDGKNMLGRLWMEIRSEIRAALAPRAGERASRDE